MFFKKNAEKESGITEKIRETFKDTPTLESDRLIYKRIVPENAQDMFDYSKCEEVTRYLLWTPHVSLTQTEKYIKLLQKKYDNGSFWDFGLTYKEDGRFIGTCGITSMDDDTRTIEIGYVLAPEYWGKELAPEAARTVMRYCFDTFGAEKICGKFMEGNNGSMRVMTKLGMTLEGIYRKSMYVKGEYKTIHVYEITKERFFEVNKF
ncbi:MAG: GNAT family N-acetyltransferase [Ruminococcaceae bacterium]|nr:GNAT family N-acetyltransferase [Oscillospiraceae bacterium]